jgi:hypothetical protein
MQGGEKTVVTYVNFRKGRPARDEEAKVKAKKTLEAVIKEAVISFHVYWFYGCFCCCCC